MTRRAKRDALVDEDTPYEEDLAARWFVVNFPDGGTLEEVGAMLSVTRERIRQIEKRAIYKLRAVCAEEGMDFRVLLTGWGLDPAAFGE